MFRVLNLAQKPKAIYGHRTDTTQKVPIPVWILNGVQNQIVKQPVFKSPGHSNFGSKKHPHVEMFEFRESGIWMIAVLKKKETVRSRVKLANLQGFFRISFRNYLQDANFLKFLNYFCNLTN